MIQAACHIHSDWSYDGKWSLSALAAMFARRRFRILMVTDHDRGLTESRQLQHRKACAQASSDRIFVLPGIEYSDADNIVHVLVWGPVPFLGEGLPTTELLKAVRASNGVAVLAHPSRREAWRVFDTAWTDYLLGIEVWNRKTDGWAPSPTAPPLLEDTALVPFVGMDFHDRNQMFPLSMEMDISPMVSEESVLDCLRARRCRAMAFSEPVHKAMQRWRGLALSSAERCRRSVAPVFRRFKRQLER